MGKFRKLGRHAAHRVSMLRYGSLRSPLVMDICRVGVLPAYRIRLHGQDDGVAAGEARAHRDHRREGTSVDHLVVGACRTGIGVSAE
jgi:hypothetical protein